MGGGSRMKWDRVNSETAKETINLQRSISTLANQRVECSEALTLWHSDTYTLANRWYFLKNSVSSQFLLQQLIEPVLEKSRLRTKSSRQCFTPATGLSNFIQPFFLNSCSRIKNTPSTNEVAKRRTYRGLHFLGGESGALSDSSGGSLLEGDSLQPLVHVQGVVAGHALQFLFLFGHSWHFYGDNELK